MCPCAKWSREAVEVAVHSNVAVPAIPMQSSLLWMRIHRIVRVACVTVDGATSKQSAVSVPRQEFHTDLQEASLKTMACGDSHPESRL